MEEGCQIRPGSWPDCRHTARRLDSILRGDRTTGMPWRLTAAFLALTVGLTAASASAERVIYDT